MLIRSLISAGKHSWEHFPNFNIEILRKGMDFFYNYNEDTRGMPMFLIDSMSVRLLGWIQLCMNLFHHLSFHNTFHLVHSEIKKWGEHVYLILSQGVQNYEVHNILLNLLLRAQIFVYQKTYFSHPDKVCWNQFYCNFMTQLSKFAFLVSG